MHLSPEEKQSLVARYHTGNSAAEICADTGIVRSTFYTRIKPCTTTKTNSGHVVSQQEFIKMKQRIQSFSAPGQPYGNAVMESFFSYMKRE